MDNSSPLTCPNCRQPILADVEQLFDVGVDPSAKQRFLSGAVNIVQCPNCGYQGSLATPGSRFFRLLHLP